MMNNHRLEAGGCEWTDLETVTAKPEPKQNPGPELMPRM
jgi:hypothetical protein